MVMEKYGVDQEAIDALVDLGLAPEEARVAAASGPDKIKEAAASVGGEIKKQVNRFADLNEEVDELIEESSRN